MMTVADPPVPPSADPQPQGGDAVPPAAPIAPDTVTAATRILCAMPAAIVGPDPGWLVRLAAKAIAIAAYEPPAGALADIVGAGNEAAFAAAQQRERKRLIDIARAAALYRAAAPPAPGQAGFAAATAAQPWLPDVDHYAHILPDLFPAPAGEAPDAYHARIRAALELLGTAPMALRAEEQSTRREDRGDAYIAVRAAYLYRWGHGLTVAVDWTDPNARSRTRNPDAAAVLAPASDMARLAWALVRALQIDAGMSTVKYHLQTYHAELRAQDRGPRLEDFVSLLGHGIARPARRARGPRG